MKADVWKRFESLLFCMVGSDRFDLWVRHVRPVELDDETWLLHVESTFARDKIDGLFRAAATEAAQTATNRRVRLRFAVEPVSFVRGPEDRLRDGPAGDAFATFVAGAGNRRALDAARAFAAGRSAILVLSAPSGLGKTHLLRAVERELRSRPGAVLFFSALQFRRQVAFSDLRGRRDAFVAMAGAAQAFLLDDLHLLGGFDAAQDALTEVLDRLAARRARLAFTTDRPLRGLPGLSAPLRRRLRPDAEAALDAPDAATSLAVLAAAYPRVPRAALEVVAADVRSSHKDQMHCVARMVELGPSTPSAARSVVGEFLSQWSCGLSYADIAREVAASFGVPLTAIYSDERSRLAADARQACYYLSRKLLGRPYAAIGDHFGGRDHATVLHACHKLDGDRGELRQRLERLERDLSARA
jgi:chromosomal replication initiator protein